MKKPKVSIVVVNWKTPELLVEAVKSALDDPAAGSFEVWVVDNNSGDGSVEILRRELPEAIVIANKENVGFAKACNQVIPSSRGDYVVLLNPDTVCVGGALGKLSAYMDAHPGCGAAGPKVLNADGTLQLSCRRSFPDLAASFYRFTYLSFLFPRNKTVSRYNLTHADPDTELEVDALSGSCMMLRRDVIDRIGLLDEDIFMFGEDIDWCWRVKQDGWTVNYVPSGIVYHYHGASSRFRRVGATVNLHKGMEVFYRKHLAAKYPAPVNWAVYAAIWSRCLLFVVLSMLQNLFESKAQPAYSIKAADSQVRQPDEAATPKESAGVAAGKS